MKFSVLAVIIALALLLAATATTRAMPAASSSANPFSSIARHRTSAVQKVRRGEDDGINLLLFSWDTDYTTMDLFLGGEWVIFAFDTARTDNWIMDKDCSVGCPVPKYWPEDSKTYKKIGDNFSVDYVDINGPITLTGSLGTDDYYYGDAISGVTIKGVTFGIANKAKRKLASTGSYTGVIGLGRQEKSQSKAPSFLSAMVKSGVAKKELFGLRLDRVDKDGLRTGMVNLGTFDSTYTPQYHSLLPKTDAWEIGLTDVLLNGASLGYKRTALFDSGSWTLRVPDKDAQEIYKKIPGSKRLDNGIYQIPSDSNVAITLQFDDKKYSMKASDMCYQYQAKKGPNCNAAIQASDTDVWSIGAPFLINVYTVFDNENKRIGLAPRGDY